MLRLAYRLDGAGETFVGETTNDTFSFTDVIIDPTNADSDGSARWSFCFNNIAVNVS